MIALLMLINFMFSPPTTTVWYSFPTFNGVSSNSLYTYYGTYQNQTTGGYFWDAFILALYIIGIFAQRRDDIVARVMISSFAMSLASSVTTIIGWTVIFIPVMIGIIGFVSFMIVDYRKTATTF